MSSTQHEDNIMRKDVFFTFALFLTTVVPAVALTLVEDGRPASTIVIGAKASVPERFAADELQKYLKEMSGAEVPIVTDAEKAAGPLILVGKAETHARIAALAKAGRIRLSASTPGSGGFMIKTVDNGLVLGGSQDRGVVYGVYDLLEDQMGCVWYAPGDDYVPERKDVKIGEVDVLEKPDISYRTATYVCGKFNLIDWSAKLKMNYAYDYLGRIKHMMYGFRKTKRDPRKARQYVKHVNREAARRGLGIHFGAHSAAYWLPPEVYFKEHPEYFSLINGKRFSDDSDSNWQYCISNPEVLKVVTGNVREFFREYPAARIVSVDPNDGAGCCRCEKCQALDEKLGMNKYLWFADQVGRGIVDTCPDKLISMNINYAPGRTVPPENYRLSRNLIFLTGHINRSLAHTLKNSKLNKDQYKFLKAWGDEYGDRTWVWLLHYNIYGTRDMMTAPSYRRIVREWRNNKADFNLMGGSSMSSGQNLPMAYVFGHATWDVNTDVERLLDHYCKAFGKAAKSMREFLRILDESMVELGQVPEKVGTRHESYLHRLLDSQEMKRLEAYIHEARQAVSGRAGEMARVEGWAKRFNIIEKYWEQSYAGQDLIPKGIKEPFVAYDPARKSVTIIGKHNLASIRAFLDRQVGMGQVIFREYEPGNWVCDAGLTLGNPVERMECTLEVGPHQGSDKVSLTVKGDLTVLDYAHLNLRQTYLNVQGLFQAGPTFKQLRVKQNNEGPGHAYLDMRNCRVTVKGECELNGGLNFNLSGCRVEATRVYIRRSASLPSAIETTKIRTQRGTYVRAREVLRNASRLSIQGSSFTSQGNEGLTVYAFGEYLLDVSVRDCLIKGGGTKKDLFIQARKRGAPFSINLVNCQYETVELREVDVLLRTWYLELDLAKGGKAVCESSLGDKYRTEAVADERGKCRLEVPAYAQMGGQRRESLNTVFVISDGKKAVIRKNWTPGANSQHREGRKRRRGDSHD